MVYESTFCIDASSVSRLLCIKVTGKRKRESKRPRIAIILLLLLAFVGGDECNGVIHKMALYFRHPLIFYNKTTVTSVLSFEMDATALLLNSPVAWALVTVSTAYIFFRWASFSTNLLSQFSDNKHLFFKLSARYVTSSFTYFSDQGIPGPKPFPLVGNMWGIWKAVK